MPIMNSDSGNVVVDYTTEELVQQAKEMRAWNLLSLHAAGSGHAGGTLSIMDITTALYLKVARLDPSKPEWADRDRIIWSVGHKAPSLYTGLAFAGFFEKKECLKLRKLYSGVEGHPNRLKLEGVEVSSGSLGQGLSVAVGSALAAKRDGKNYRVFCLMGDGEQQEGQIWEAVMEAAHYNLDNLVGIVDQNGLQIDGKVEDVMKVEPLTDKYESFGWNVITCDGHDMADLLNAFAQAEQSSGKPSVIIAKTVKGKGVSFMEDIAGWHGKAPNRDELMKGLSELGVEMDVDELLQFPTEYQQEVDRQLDELMPKFKQDYWWNTQPTMKVEMRPTRMGFGDCLDRCGEDPRVYCLGADISGSIQISRFYENHPERSDRWCSMGISEQSGTCVAAGLAKEGKIPVFGTYGVFAAGRALDQLRTTVCYNNYNVKIAGAHGGVSVGPDGATHQALEEFFQVCSLPGMHVVAGADSIEMDRLTEACLFDIDGPCYLRFAREAAPIVTTKSTPLQFGVANIIRYRGSEEQFVDAFQTILASEYLSENETAAIITNGPELAEAMRAAWILKEEYDLETRVVNLHTLKPMDTAAVVQAAEDCSVVLTVEEHQVGGIGNYVAAAIMQANLPKAVTFDMIGVEDQFGMSGAPWELVKAFGLTAEHIADKVLKMTGKR